MEQRPKENEVKVEESCLVLMSNVNKSDKLNRFVNPIPAQFLSEHQTHFAAVIGLGVHAIFKNTAISQNSMPSMLVLFRKEFTFQTGYDLPRDVTDSLPLNKFKAHQCIFLDPSQSYTPHQLHQHLFQTVAAFNYSLEQMHRGFASR